MVCGVPVLEHESDGPLFKNYKTTRWKSLQELLDVRDNKFFKAASWLWRNTFARLGEDWVFLALLGIIMALLSYVMDKGISMCTNCKCAG